MKFAFKALCFAIAMVAAPATAQQQGAVDAYDLLFKNGTLDDIDRAKEIRYRREVISLLKPDAAQRDTGQIAISFPADLDAMAQLEFRQNDKFRSLGSFPATVGNPMIMFFYESVVRDMAESAGGSPFYIRNRVKDALVQPSVIETGSAVIDGQTVKTQTVKLYPFETDPNKSRMQGFGDLELSVTMSEDVPGWYVSLIADAPGGQDGTSVYRSEFHYEGVEVSQSK